MNKSECLVIIPAYNEERNISRLIREVKSHGFPVLVVDDGSKDATVPQAMAEGAEVLVATVNQGKGAALRRGFDWFLKKNYAALIVMDSDGQHDPKELDLFLKALDCENIQVVVGNRLDNPTGMPWIRHTTNRFMSWIVSSVTKQKVVDSQCGYRAVKREVLQKIKLQTAHFEIESEILFEAARAGFTIASVPISCVYQNEKSHINPFRDTLRFFSFLFKYLARR